MFNELIGPTDGSKVTIEYAKHPITIALRGMVYTNIADPLQSQVSIDREAEGTILLDIQHLDDLDKLIDQLLEHRLIITKQK